MAGVCIASTSIVAHVLAIVIHVLYINSVVKNYSSSYVYIVSDHYVYSSM